MQLRSDSFAPMAPIPAEFSYGQPGVDGQPVVDGGNRSPHLAWRDAPAGTRSFVLMCIDSDVPSVFDDANQAGRSIPADMPRIEFVHWLMLDIAPEIGELGAGSCADGVVPGGNPDPFGPPGSRQGGNDFGPGHFGYDGPCPPWNDERLHHYHFSVHALDVARLDVPDAFTLTDVRKAMAGHELASASYTGTYTLNPALRG